MSTTKPPLARPARDRVRQAFQRVLFGALGTSVRPTLTRALRRIHNHLYNCSTDPQSNGESWLVQQLPKSGVFFDVGFNRGSWTREVLDACPGAVIHGFDPNREVPATLDALALPAQRFTFHPLALSNAPGSATFYDYGDLHEMSSLHRTDHELLQHEPSTYDVEVSTVDRVADALKIQTIDVLKVDAEGFDLHIIEGARSMFEQQRIGLAVFEYGAGWFTSKRTLSEANDLFSEVGYTLYRLFPHFLAPYRYRVEHEGGLGGYFVALSRETDAKPIPKRDICL